MRPLLKRKPEAATSAEPPWHPNFRNFEELPDTKVVRTVFFVNGIAIVVALVMLLWFSFQAYQLHDLRRQIDAVQRQIDGDRALSGKTVAQYKQFQTEVARVGEVEAFVDSKPRVSELLLRLAATLPDNIAFDGFDFHDLAVTLRGTVRGAPDQASGYVSTYLEQLKSDPVLGPKFADISLASLDRNPSTGRLELQIAFKLKGAKETKKR